MTYIITIAHVPGGIEEDDAPLPWRMTDAYFGSFALDILSDAGYPPTRGPRGLATLLRGLGWAVEVAEHAPGEIVRHDVLSVLTFEGTLATHEVLEKISAASRALLSGAGLPSDLLDRGTNDHTYLRAVLQVLESDGLVSRAGYRGGWSRRYPDPVPTGA